MGTQSKARRGGRQTLSLFLFRITLSAVSFLRLTPDILAVILKDALPAHLTLFDLMADPQHALRQEQREKI